MLGARYVEFEGLSIAEKTSYVLGSKKWENSFAAYSEGVHRSRMGSAKTKTIW